MTDTPERIRAWETTDYNGQWTVAEFGGVEYIRADLATPAPAVKVKDLVWQAGDKYGLVSGPYTANGMSDFSYGLFYGEIELGRFKRGAEGLRKLKAFANAHNKTYILAALEPAPATPLDDPRVAALVEKARAVVDRWDSPLWKDLPHTSESIADLRAAISALEKNK